MCGSHNFALSYYVAESDMMVQSSSFRSVGFAIRPNGSTGYKWTKVLSLGKLQINLRFHSLIRVFGCRPKSFRSENCK